MPFDAARLVSLPQRIIHHRYTIRDTMLYALGVGAGQRSDDTELQFVYENGLRSLPTMAVILAYPGFWQMEPEYRIDWRHVLHAEQSCTFHRPIPAEGEVRGEMSIDAIVDKGVGKGCFLRATRRIFDASDGNLLATVRQVSFLRGDGGCGTHGEPLPSPDRVPDRSPDATLGVITRPEQALLYRLSGDFNPLHIDRSVASAAGLSAPILHGLCSYGIVGREILGWACGHAPEVLRGLNCRFSAPIYPGEALEIDLWNDHDGNVAFRVRVPERDVVVLDCGYAILELDPTR